MSDPLSKIYCIYCEYQWKRSLFDSTSLDLNRGLLRISDLSSDGYRALSDLADCDLSQSGNTPLVCCFLRCYADDCRCICYYGTDSPYGSAVASALVEHYKRHCYIEPCKLEDEDRGCGFDFLHGCFSFDSTGCHVSYLHKNADSLLAGEPRKFRTLQHFWYYGQPNRSLRLATVCGKLNEIDHFSSTPLNAFRAILSICVEFHHLRYPLSLLRDATYRMETRTRDSKWLHLFYAAKVVYDSLGKL